MTERPGPDTLDVHYVLTVEPGERATDKARGVALEQSVELPFACVPAAQHGMVPEQRRLDPVDEDPDGTTRWHLQLAFPPGLIDDEPLQLLNVLFGNISLKQGIRIVDIEWPRSLLRLLGGPRVGIADLRRHLGIPDRALTCTALKPVGRTATELAADCEAFARGGIDLIKDDHGLTNQRTAPYEDRLRRCQAAVGASEGETRRLYLPNITAPREQLDRRVQAAVDAGCSAVLVCPFLTGLDVLPYLRSRYPVAIMAHPAFGGAVASQAHGLAPEILLGDLLRLLGADAVIHPNAGGRFPTYDQPLCDRIVDRLRRPLGGERDGIQPAWPTPGGGVDLDQVPAWVHRYGCDTILLIGGSLYAQGDLVAAARRFRDAVGSSVPEIGPGGLTARHRP